MNPSSMANYRHVECLAGTRVEILHEVHEWLLAPNDGQNILWLNGMAGSGKSTIAKTIARNFRAIRRCGAFLFFERGKSGPEAVVRTLAHQLAEFDVGIRARVCEQLENNPSESLGLVDDFDGFLAGPLSSAEIDGPIVVILDALDECGDSKSRSALLSLLSRQFRNLPPNFRFLITSRPELDIERAFNQQANVRSWNLDTTTSASTEDVKLFFEHELVEVRHMHSMKPDWPSTASVGQLVDSSTLR